MPRASIGATRDEAGARAVYEAYRAAMLARDGRRALSLVDRRTIEAYERYVELALTVDRAGLTRLGWTAKFMVLRIRHGFDRRALEAMTGASLFILAIERGWYADAGVADVEIAAVRIAGLHADITYTVEPDVPVHFLAWEPGGWRLALWKTIPLVDRALQPMFEGSGAPDEVEWIVSLIEADSPKKFDRALLDGPPD